MSEVSQTLKGEEAIRLWMQGSEAWNVWVSHNPEYNVNFMGVDFSQHRSDSPHTMGAWPFANYHFPNGSVSFDFAKFGDGIVSFLFVNFGDGNVTFQGAKFGDGHVTFQGAKFGDGDVNFHNSEFGAGWCVFTNAQFGDGNLYFIDAKFGADVVLFHSTKFGNGDVNFNNSEFGDRGVSFANSKFGDGDVIFSSVKSLGNIDFTETEFGDGRFSFEYADINHLSFNNIKGTQQLTKFSLRHAIVNKGLIIDAPEGFSCVLDLVSTMLSRHLDLHNINCVYQKNKRYFFMSVAKDSLDIGRLQRLKQLSLDNGAHEQAIDYKIQEMQARRIHQHKNIFKLGLEGLFFILSDYGRSVFLPFGWLLGCTFFIAFYFGMNDKNDSLWKAGECTLAHGLPLMSYSKFLVNDAACAFLKLPTLLPTMYSVFCLLLVFLVGLGLRHRFRL
jgi:hypothetical protein